MTANDKIPKGYEETAALALAVFNTHEDLRERIELIQERQRTAGKRLLPGLKRKIAAHSAARDELREHIEASPDLFEKPRTRALHGVKAGLRQQPGKLEIDAEAAPGLIRKFMPERYKALVKVETKLQAAPLKNLKPAELARIGGRIVDLGDEVVISIPKSPVEKLVEALLEDLDDDPKEERAAA
ncbi:MAG: hypothetical protein OXN96_19170 [Bryobacterales bacterium]|nr:hypothetical protein [Bryobacterales bacterium]